ncbi:MAG: hypothetical protein WCP32_10620, partial [Bacteroidota bacterium]
GGYFLWPWLSPKTLVMGSFPLGSMALCVVPTFLSKNGATERTVVTAKVRLYAELCLPLRHEGFELRE